MTSFNLMIATEVVSLLGGPLIYRLRKVKTVVQGNTDGEKEPEFCCTLPSPDSTTAQYCSLIPCRLSQEKEASMSPWQALRPQRDWLALASSSQGE